MSPSGKTTTAAAATILLLAVLLGFAFTISNEAIVLEGDYDYNEMPVENQLWEARTLDLLILSVMMFGAVVGVLALVGGEFRWN